MAHVLRDFFTGSLILVALTLSALVGFILFLILNVFFHIFGALVVAFFFIFLIFFAVWFIGFVFRKIREDRRERT
ncbi:MAG: hypothetical protein A4E62_00193 [Syntrophorhabdus sp. PtaU1.Bin002]|nr:MAG: hypothetical protein A4E58_02816 [Syntrophorhabdus sp. PtaB.Bin006]OPY73926.1 MAG: hypothetical protein A4E62_00193 [Syntrophorhabdus sp. PtaU1.Bin002]